MDVDTVKTVEGSEGSNSYRVPIELRYDLIPPLMLKRLAAIYEEGAKKYGQAKYIEKPLPYSVIVNHLLNHLNLWISGDRKEDHLAKVLWGVTSLMVLEEMRENGLVENMNDLSRYGAHAFDAVRVRREAVKTE